MGWGEGGGSDKALQAEEAALPQSYEISLDLLELFGVGPYAARHVGMGISFREPNLSTP